MDVPQFFSLKDVSSLASVAAILLVFIVWCWLNGQTRKLAHIPTVGPAGILTSSIRAFRFVNDGKNMIQEGYDKHKGSTFKVPRFYQWLVIVTSPQAIEDLRQAAECDLSFSDAMEETMAFSYTIGSNIHSDLLRSTLRNQLTKNIGTFFPNVREEMMQAFNDEMPLTTDWTKVSAVKAIMHIVGRTSNQVFVGLPLCRNSDWVNLNTQFTKHVMEASRFINLLPSFLKPIGGRLAQSNAEATIRQCMKHLLPIILERKQHIAENGAEWEGKPNDMLSWLMDGASEAEGSARNLTLLIMSLNFAAIHTSTMAFTQALYSLAAMPRYLQPMREEVEAVISEEGWTESAVDKLYKVDSFLKESMRLNHLQGTSLYRKSVRDFTFTDGTFIPKGTLVSTATAVQHDEDYFVNSEVFDGFRFVDSEASDEDNRKRQMVTPANSYLVFGQGRNACPGRFFAAKELKAMMAHLVLNYDVKLENDGVRPSNARYAESYLPNQKAEVLFRKRQ